MMISQRQIDILHAVERDLASGSPNLAIDKSLLHAVINSLDPDPPLSRAELIVRFEQGEMDDEAAFLLFQDMIDDGTAWTISVAYGKMADTLISQGVCKRPTAATYRAAA